jgi:hypothetical protein
MGTVSKLMIPSDLLALQIEKDAGYWFSYSSRPQPAGGYGEAGTQVAFPPES